MQNQTFNWFISRVNSLLTISIWLSNFILDSLFECSKAREGFRTNLNPRALVYINPPTSVETFFVFRSGVKLRRLRIKIPKISRVSDSLTFI